jgi:AraC-like DNA-binding protein
MPSAKALTTPPANLPEQHADEGAVVDYSFGTANLDEFQHVTSNLISPHRLVPLAGHRHFDCEVRFHGLGDLGTFYLRHGARIAGEIPAETSDGRVVFVQATKGHGKLTLGRKDFDFSGQSAVVVTSGERKTLHHLESEMTALVMDRAKISAYCAKLLGREVDSSVVFDAVFRGDGSSAQSWLRLFHYASAELGDAHSLIRTLPFARQQLEQMVITGFLFGHSHNFSNALLQPQSSAAPYYVKRAEAYIEAHFAHPLSLADIAAHASVSARSLQNGFQSFRGTTPMAFLRSVRVQHAHRALLAADPVTSTVMDIAMNCGFSHMGEFAAIYKRTFGTAPSQTLLKAAYR